VRARRGHSWGWVNAWACARSGGEGTTRLWACARSGGEGTTDIHARACEGVVGMSGAEDVAGGRTVVCGRLHYVLKR
jgi:hypothetical protein